MMLARAKGIQGLWSLPKKAVARGPIRRVPIQTLSSVSTEVAGKSRPSYRPFVAGVATGIAVSFLALHSQRVIRSPESIGPSEWLSFKPQDQVYLDHIKSVVTDESKVSISFIGSSRELPDYDTYCNTLETNIRYIISQQNAEGKEFVMFCGGRGRERSGMQAVFEVADRLAKQGLNVTLYSCCPKGGFPNEQIESTITKGSLSIQTLEFDTFMNRQHATTSARCVYWGPSGPGTLYEGIEVFVSEQLGKRGIKVLASMSGPKTVYMYSDTVSASILHTLESMKELGRCHNPFEECHLEVLKN